MNKDDYSGSYKPDGTFRYGRVTEAASWATLDTSLDRGRELVELWARDSGWRRVDDSRLVFTSDIAGAFGDALSVVFGGGVEMAVSVQPRDGQAEVYCTASMISRFPASVQAELKRAADTFCRGVCSYLDRLSREARSQAGQRTGARPFRAMMLASMKWAQLGLLVAVIAGNVAILLVDPRGILFGTVTMWVVVLFFGGMLFRFRVYGMRVRLVAFIFYLLLAMTVLITAVAVFG